MVLQQNEDVKFWGWASNGEEVVIKPSWTTEVYKTKTNKYANWELFIKTPSFGGPFTITISGYNTIELKDVFIGEVWLCSGQSNMEMTPTWFGGINNLDEEVNNAHHPNIRFFNIPKISTTAPQINVPAFWDVCTPETMKNSSAVAYFFARALQENFKDIPIGLMISAWGGTPAEIWMPEKIITEDSVLLEASRQLKPVEWGPTEPARAYNAMIHPLAGFNLAGALWYQGESNVGALNYDKTLTALINSWRTLWSKSFPVYYVQIAPFEYGEDHYGGAEIRNAQRKVLEMTENTGMIVIDDVSTVDDIHPKDKKTVGLRLANLALKNHYKTKKGLVESPIFKDAIFNKNKAEVYFYYSEGLYIKDEKSLFEVAGDDRAFYPAKAKVKENHIIVSSRKVKDPKYVRFGWQNTAQSNVFNKANLPASIFTTE